jgi:chromosomal replication initiation ATPase DnaA
MNTTNSQEKYFIALNPSLTFERFVVGAGSRFAYAAAKSISEGPGAYNPLFIYGGSGQGKTHLLHAIGNYILQARSTVRVMYITAEHFSNQWIESIAKNQTGSFINSLRSVDVLLIDDIDFLSGREQTQEFLFHSIDHLLIHNKQVVFTSKLSPNELPNFMDRLKKRFTWGLIVDIHSLSSDISIHHFCKNENIPLSPEQIKNLEQRTFDNVAELLAAIHQMVSYQQLTESISIIGKEGAGDKNEDREIVPFLGQEGDVWNQVLLILEGKLSKASFETWFKPTKARWDGDTFRIVANNEFMRDWLENRYQKLISQTIYTLTGKNFTLQFLVENDNSRPPSTFFKEIQDHLPLSNKESNEPLVIMQQDLKELKQLSQEMLNEFKKTNALLDKLLINEK